MIKPISWCSLLLLCLLPAACDLLDPAEDQVAIRVGERKISLKAVRQDVERIGTEMGLSAEEIRPVFEPLVERLVERYILLAYGNDQGITVSNGELSAAVREIKDDYASEQAFQDMLLRTYVDFGTWEDQLKERLLLRKIIAKGLESVKPVTFQEIRSEYERDLTAYKHPAMVRFRQLVARTEDEAREILKLFEQGEDLGTLIRHAPERFDGVVGVPDRWAVENELEEGLAEAVFSLPVGLAKKPVKTPYGFHVVDVMDKRPEGVMSLPEVKAQIEERLLEEKRETFYRDWIAELKTQYPVKLNRKVLDRLEIG